MIALIPARAGSKGIKDKNISLVNGYPLIAFSIKVALACELIDKVVVSTDSNEISNIALSYGAEVPFLRPIELSNDLSVDIEYVKHFLDWCYLNNINLEHLVLLRPTTPLRCTELIEAAIYSIVNNSKATSLRSVHELTEPPQKMLRINNGFLDGFFQEDERKEYFNLPRQSFQPAYQPNGYIDIVKPSCIVDSLFGDYCLPFITDTVVEIDTTENLEYLRYITKRDGYEYL